jgi:hypothetical protein
MKTKGGDGHVGGKGSLPTGDARVVANLFLFAGRRDFSPNFQDFFHKKR